MPIGIVEERICYFGILLVIWFVMHLGLPRERELLPAYPVIVLFLEECVTEVCDICRNKIGSDQNKRRYRYFTYALSAVTYVAMVLLFLFRMDVESYSDWRDEKDYKKIAYDAITDSNADYEAIANMDYPMQYYWAQIYLGEGFDIYTGQRVE